jgi:hypothetical protein
MKNPKIIYEPEDDVLNIWLSKEPYEYAEQSGDMIVHFTKDNDPVYIEILEATKFIKSLNDALPKKIQKEVLPQFPISVSHRIKK